MTPDQRRLSRSRRSSDGIRDALLVADGNSEAADTSMEWSEGHRGAIVAQSSLNDGLYGAIEGAKSHRAAATQENMFYCSTILDKNEESKSDKSFTNNATVAIVYSMFILDVLISVNLSEKIKISHKSTQLQFH